MKRKQTRFHTALINNGFRLDSKVYHGKNSESVLAYVFTYTYRQCNTNFKFFLEVRKSDDKILDMGLLEMPFTRIGFSEKWLLDGVFKEMNCYIRDIEYATKYVGSRANDNLNEEEIVQVAEEIGAEDE